MKADAQRLWAKLLKLYEGGAHIALGYSSWADYCKQEFRMSDGRAYQLLQAARVVHQLTIVSQPQVTSQVPESEAIARELAPLLRNPQALDEAWDEAVEEAHGVPTAQGVREVVARKLASTPTEKKPLHDLEGIDPNRFKLATRAIGLVDGFSKFVETAKPEDVWNGLRDHEKSTFFANCMAIGGWINFIGQIRAV